MKPQNALIEELQQLEGVLSSVAVTVEVLSRLLADECVEFGASGLRYNKQQILGAIKSRRRGEGDVMLSEFEVDDLGPGVVLVTYRALRLANLTPVCSWRSSIWRNEDGQWRLVFHQGTATGCP
jgi:hypothetical protein